MKDKRMYRGRPRKPHQPTQSVMLEAGAHTRLKSLSRDLSIPIRDLLTKAVNKFVDEYDG